MWEVVKTVKGYDITRMVGSRGAYHVSVREGKGFREFHTFKTIKAAVEFIETALQALSRGKVPGRKEKQNEQKRRMDNKM